MSTHTVTRPQQRVPGLERWALPGVIAITLLALVAAVIATRPGGSSTGGDLSVGSPAPQFSALDAVSGKPMSLADLRGQRTLLFFSEGAACQACLVQIANLQSDPALAKAGVRLVSVSTDSPSTLSAAARQYGITTPMLSDSSTQMSSDYGMLGRGGMGHPSADGHAFMLLDAQGKIAWQQSYSQMYVPPGEVVGALPTGG